jgi:hypothetical protein
MHQQSIGSGSHRRGFVKATFAVFGAILARPALALGFAGQLVPVQAGSTTSDTIPIGRRIVTGIDAQGRSKIDSDTPNRPVGGRSTDVWVIRKLPAPVNGPLEPPPDFKWDRKALPGGAIVRLLTWPLGYKVDRHNTFTLDLLFIVSGQLELIMDTGTKVVAGGDMVVQRATAHAFRVVGDAPCIFYGVAFDAAAA